MKVITGFGMFLSYSLFFIHQYEVVIFLIFFTLRFIVAFKNNLQYTHAVCANPKLPVASRTCCGITLADVADHHYKTEYHSEMVTAGTNVEQCVADGGK